MGRWVDLIIIIIINTFDRANILHFAVPVLGQKRNTLQKKMAGGYQADGTTWRNLTTREQGGLRKDLSSMEGLEEIATVKDLSPGISPIWAPNFSLYKKNLIKYHPDKGGSKEEFVLKWDQYDRVRNYVRRVELIDLTPEDDDDDDDADDDDDDDGISDSSPTESAPENGKDDDEKDTEVNGDGDPVLLITRDPSSYVRQKVRVAGMYEGEVEEIWRSRQGEYFHHVKYSDGDEEDLTWEELDPLWESQTNKVDDKGSVGYKFIKEFHKDGTVVNTSEINDRLFLIVVFDGDDIRYMDTKEYEECHQAYLDFVKESEKMEREHKKAKTEPNPHDEAAKRRRRCDKCGPCITNNCNDCKFCKDRIYNRRKLKQCCALRQCELLHPGEIDRCGKCDRCKRANCTRCKYCIGIIKGDRKLDKKCCVLRECVGQNS